MKPDTGPLASPLRHAGFRWYPARGGAGHLGVWQRGVTDHCGTRYIVNVLAWDWSALPDAAPRVSYTAEARFRRDAEEFAVELLTVRDPAQVLRFFALAWAGMACLHAEVERERAAS